MSHDADVKICLCVHLLATINFRVPTVDGIVATCNFVELLHFD